MIQLRIGDIEIRPVSATEKLTQPTKKDDNGPLEYEVVKWQMSTCYVLSTLTYTEEMYDVHTVGDRPYRLNKEDLNNYITVIKTFYNYQNDDIEDATN